MIQLHVGRERERQSRESCLKILCVVSSVGLGELRTRTRVPEFKEYMAPFRHLLTVVVCQLSHAMSETE